MLHMPSFMQSSIAFSLPSPFSGRIGLDTRQVSCVVATGKPITFRSQKRTHRRDGTRSSARRRKGTFRDGQAEEEANMFRMIGVPDSLRGTGDVADGHGSRVAYKEPLLHVHSRIMV